jgi:hypothetical protein
LCQKKTARPVVTFSSFAIGFAQQFPAEMPQAPALERVNEFDWSSVGAVYDRP